MRRAEAICHACVTYGTAEYAARDRRLDRLLTSRATGYPVMLLGLAGVLWLTIAGANAPSEWLARGLTLIQAPTRMEFGYTCMALDPDGHRLRLYCPAPELG